MPKATNTRHTHTHHMPSVENMQMNLISIPAIGVYRQTIRSNVLFVDICWWSLRMIKQ